MAKSWKRNSWCARTRQGLAATHHAWPRARLLVITLPVRAVRRESPCMNHAITYSLRLCTWSGIAVYVHWSWFVVAYLEIVRRVNPYTSLAWNVLEYLTLFGIVVLHEFGHAFACRQVGGRADKIVLWPLGGAAFVHPPPRP